MEIDVFSRLVLIEFGDEITVQVVDGLHLDCARGLLDAASLGLAEVDR